MSTQLRLVDPPARRGAGTKHARTSGRRGRRAARWDVDWRLDANTRRAGRAGVAAARDALTRAADQDLREAS
ncbi:MAG TPA: hypothetical protein VLV81_04225 [Acidimicrobiia bacterium]|nr:hypothetical protein [Acidimicrobiia bacterium]